MSAVAISPTSVRDYKYKAIFTFTPEYMNSSLGNGNVYKFYRRTGTAGAWTLLNKDATEYVASKMNTTQTIKDEGTFKDYDCANYLLVASVDNLEKSFYYANFIDTKLPELSQTLNINLNANGVNYTSSTTKWSLTNNPDPAHTQGDGQPTSYKIYTTEPLNAVEIPQPSFANASTAKVIAEVNNTNVDTPYITLTVTSTNTSDKFAATDYINIRFTDKKGNVGEASIYCIK